MNKYALDHSPGLTDVICDALSRRFDPNKKFVLPALLTAIKAIVPPRRDDLWWKTLQRSKSLKGSPAVSWEDQDVGPLHLAKLRRKDT